MRKSINEKLHIVKQSTSPKKIKKLSIQHGVTTKTIRNWIRQAGEGKLIYNPGNGNTNVSPKKGLGRISRPMSEFVYKVSAIDNPVKISGRLYRHLFKDTVTGMVFCGYSDVKDESILVDFCECFISVLKKYGYTSKI